MSSFKVPRSCRQSPRHSRLATSLAAILLLWPVVAMSATEGPFRAFLGNWKGAGDIVAADGHKERVTCRASYASTESGVTLTQSLVCASDSYRFDVKGVFVAEGGTLKGHWAETTRNISGDLLGRVGNGDFEGMVTGPNFTAQMAVKSKRTEQLVSIKPSGGDIASIEVTLQRLR